MTTGKSNLIELEGKLLHETKKAFFVSIEGENVWLPKSMVEFEDGMMTIPEWLAIEKRLV